MIKMGWPFRVFTRFTAAAVVFSLASLAPARATDPIRIGLSVALTGAVAANGKQVLLSMQVWKDDINAKGGLLGRLVEFVYYDDQSNPSLYSRHLHKAD